MHTSPCDADRCHQLRQWTLDNLDFIFCNKFSTLDLKKNKKKPKGTLIDSYVNFHPYLDNFCTHICRENIHPLPQSLYTDQLNSFSCPSLKDFENMKKQCALFLAPLHLEMNELKVEMSVSFYMTWHVCS